MELIKQLNVDEMRALMESDLLWREEEFIFFKNQLSNITDDNKKNTYRKSLVLILYSHLEGFIKTCLLTYIQYLNSLCIKNTEVVSGLKASSLDQEFIKFNDKELHFKEIRNKDGTFDGVLDRFYRRVELIDGLDSMNSKQLKLDDSVINTESNLWYVVLQKNLYKIGLPINLFENNKNGIDALVSRRNTIAHGSMTAGISEAEFSKWESNTKNIMTSILITLFDYAKNKKYLKVEA